MKAVALGNFDGVHTAHKTVLKNAARFDESVCLLFKEHPLSVLSGRAPERILDARSTEEKILECGITRCEYLDFASVKDYSPEKFFEEILIKKIGADVVCCGYNYTFGKNKAGDVSLLSELCGEKRVRLIVAQAVETDGEPVSSTRIRECIKNGEIEKANKMLSYPYFFVSGVEEGKKLGRELGFPTINQYLPESVLKPKSGVYASEITIESKRYRGLTNIGSNPTIGGDSFRSETYIFDFNGDAYGKTARIELLSFIREEKKFDSLEALKSQVLSDIERAKANV